MAEINIYCDESRHLEKDTNSLYLVIGAVTCYKDDVKKISQRIREEKRKHNLSKSFEIKWSKVSASKSKFYLDIIDLFFDIPSLSFRAVVVDKSKLDHKKYMQTHDQFIYKMHFEVIHILLDPANRYCIYIDMKDTQGGRKILELHNAICNSKYDFEKKIVRSVVQVQAEQVELIQVCDLLIGAIAYANNNFQDINGKTNKGKVDVVRRIRQRTGYNLATTTLPRESKFNLLSFPKQ